MASDVDKAPAPIVAWRSRQTDHKFDDVRRQMGFVPWNAMDMCGVNVISLYPLTAEVSQRKGKLRRTVQRTQPWPTLYWLTCPEARAAVSRLEVR